MHTLHIQSYSYEEQKAIFPMLAESVSRCGGIVVSRRAASRSLLELCVEISLGDVLELYCALVAAGLELTRSAHLRLTELCLYGNYYAETEQDQAVSIYVEISFLEENNPHGQWLNGPIPT
jgi:hypothetical protein